MTFKKYPEIERLGTEDVQEILNYSEDPRKVMKDMLEEEISTIFLDYSFLDFKEIRSVVPKMCYKVLCEVMNERAGIR